MIHSIGVVYAETETKLVKTYLNGENNMTDCTSAVYAKNKSELS